MRPGSGPRGFERRGRFRPTGMPPPRAATSRSRGHLFEPRRSSMPASRAPPRGNGTTGWRQQCCREATKLRQIDRAGERFLPSVLVARVVVLVLHFTDVLHSQIRYPCNELQILPRCPATGALDLFRDRLYPLLYVRVGRQLVGGQLLHRPFELLDRQRVVVFRHAKESVQAPERAQGRTKRRVPSVLRC